MRCTKCGTESTTSRKFCAACGSPLPRRCPKCGAENAPSSAFCEDCGAALAGNAASAAASSPQVAPTAPEIHVTREQPDASTTPEGERKTVTALFADIMGSTELMEELDPEEARAIIDPALKLMIDAAHRYDGYIVQSTGDGIFALFGAPLAHEDHPQRALYAALRMQEEMGRYSAKVITNGGMPIEARIGVNTGEVVVRSITTGAGQSEYTPIGHTTNLASRMQVVAPTGSIAISEQTRKLVEGYFQLKPRGPTRVKGLSEPVNVYEVTGLGPLRTRLQRAVGRGLTKFVGREREMESLRHAAEQAKSGRGQIVAAMAEPGVGKSRLYFEFKAQSGWMVLETFSLSHGKASAYLPVLDLLYGYFKIMGEDDQRTRREKLTGRVLALDRSLEDTLPYLFSLLAIAEGADPLAQMDGQIKKRRTLEAIKRIVLRESLNQPLMVIFEDLHWIDEQTQELLNLLADSIGTAKILLLVSYRPEYSHQWNNKTYYTQLRLDPLGKESAEEMISALLGDGKDLIPLKRLIIERTEGTPFFMEEFVQALFEDGALQRNGAVKLAKSMKAVNVPATVQATLAARIDRLSPAEKELLQTLAVLGREFPLGLVKHVTLRTAGELERGLSRLQAGEFIYEQVAAGDIEYIFKHALTQEVAYNALLVERRKQLHERAGEALESLFAGQLEDHLDELAHHYSRSTNTEKAIEYLHLAGRQAMQRSAHTEAITQLTTALTFLLTGPDTPKRTAQELALQVALGPSLQAAKGWAAPEVEHAYSRALELCEQVGETRQLFSALFGLQAFYAHRPKLRTARELAERGLALAQRAHDPALLLEACHMLGYNLLYLGELTLAREHSERGTSLYFPQHHSLAFLYGGDDPGVCCLCHRAHALWALGYPDKALKSAQDALTLAQGLSHPFSMALALIFATILHQLRRERQAAEELIGRAISLSAEHGFPYFLAWGMILQGWALTEQGQPARIALIGEGLGAYQATGAGSFRPYHLALLAGGYRSAGQADAALAAVTEALTWVDKSDERFYEAELHRLKGELLLKRQAQRSGARHTSEATRSQRRSRRCADEMSSPRVAPRIVDSNAAEAKSCFERAVEIARNQSAKSWELRAIMSLARLLDSQGKRAEARAMLAEIYNWFTEGFDTPDLIGAKALLEELGS